MHVGVIIKKYIETNRISKAALARAVGISNTMLLYYLKAETMQIDMIIKISTALKYNFLADMAKDMPKEWAGNKYLKNEEEITELKALREENKTLRLKYEVVYELAKEKK